MWLHRLWDIRMNRQVKRFRGHQNTSRNFVRAAFGAQEALVIGGSEVRHNVLAISCELPL